MKKILKAFLIFTGSLLAALAAFTLVVFLMVNYPYVAFVLFILGVLFVGTAVVYEEIK